MQKQKQVSLETANRYISRFGGYYESYWTHHDTNHVRGNLRLVSHNGATLAKVNTQFKPLPKCTIAGMFISLALEGKDEVTGVF